MKKTLITALIIFVAVNLFAIGYARGTDEPLRLHVIANSDSPADQAVKLKVRDTVLEYTAQNVMDSMNAQQAKEAVTQDMPGLVAAIERTLKEEGFAYGAVVKTGRFYFPDRTYGDVTYPAGMYDAVKVELGAAQGKNWWCVIFPPLCVIKTEPGSSADADVKGVQFTSIFSSLF